MSLSQLATATYSTKRNPSVSVTDKTTGSVTHLTGVKCLPLLPLVGSGMSGGNIPNAPKVSVGGRVKAYWLTSAEYQTHVDGGVSVTQVPDIVEGDVLVAGGNNYKVREVDNYPATSTLLAFIYVTVEESR